ncbi:cyclic nucleotide-binding domain-containing protein [Pedobacter petrophilus]|uniref:Cyclic nucleotide-binding domain-containing protein n=2 Tax=Pedobacter TaxID=84567 RepID=A0A7K0G4R1_9SPHI|nr:Crp/Fnr family transcriptional regulator [Pedobacter petrophilus]MRX78803.1 cyclic nucleotide-binding domain-containing protein [Pedobacter petrophilus]
MKEFIDYLLQFGNLNTHQIDLIKGKAKVIYIQKDEYFSEAGKIPKQVGFILEGVVRFLYYNNKGKEITQYFIDENNFVSDQQRFEAQVVASEYIQAVTDCKLLVFSKKDWDEIGNTIVGWHHITELIVKNCLLKTIERRSPLVSEDATSRYNSFIEQFPGLVNRVPLSHIASYLGITQQSFSRIRKNIR